MKLLKLTCLFALLCAGALVAEARTVTLTVGGNVQTNEVAIQSNEVATLKTWMGAINYSSVTVQRDGFPFSVIPLNSNGGVNGVVCVAGPAVIQLYVARNLSAMLTLEIAPDSFPPDRCIIVPDGTGANIALESSTNLINWVDASAGAYTNKVGNKFFRIRADRIP